MAKLKVSGDLCGGGFQLSRSDVLKLVSGRNYSTENESFSLSRGRKAKFFKLSSTLKSGKQERGIGFRFRVGLGKLPSEMVVKNF